MHRCKQFVRLHRGGKEKEPRINTTRWHIHKNARMISYHFPANTLQYLRNATSAHGGRTNIGTWRCQRVLSVVKSCSSVMRPDTSLWHTPTLTDQGSRWWPMLAVHATLLRHVTHVCDERLRSTLYNTRHGSSQTAKLQDTHTARWP